jgi:hypothetical protein
LGHITFADLLAFIIVVGGFLLPSIGIVILTWKKEH